MNFYPFHIGDYVSATRHLSWDEDGAYRRLLDTYYTMEKPLPADVKACCRLVMAQTDSQREAVKTVLEEFFILTPAGWVNTRADAEIANLKERQQAARNKANKRWHKPGTDSSNAVAMPQHEEEHAAASNPHAKAMLPVPVPVPVPISTLRVEGACAPPLPEPAKPAKPKRRKSAELTFDEFAADCRATNTPAIPDGDPIQDYAAKAGITPEMMRLCWQAFRERYSGTDKKQADWRAHFRNGVRANWFRIWYVAENGEVHLTTVGKITEKVAA